MLKSQKLRFCWGPEAEATLCTAFFPLHCPLQMAPLRPDHNWWINVAALYPAECGRRRCGIQRACHQGQLATRCWTKCKSSTPAWALFDAFWCWKFETWALNYLPQFIRSHCLPTFRRSHGEESIESPHWMEHDPIPCFARFSLKLLCFLPSGCDIPLRSSSIAQAKDTTVAAEVHWWCWRCWKLGSNGAALDARRKTP